MTEQQDVLDKAMKKLQQEALNVESVFTIIDKYADSRRWIDISGLMTSGKTTLLHSIIAKFKSDAIHANCLLPVVEVFDHFREGNTWESEGKRLEEYLNLLDRKINAGVKFSAKVIIGIEDHPHLFNSAFNPLGLRKTALGLLLKSKGDIVFVTTRYWGLNSAALGLGGTTQILKSLALNIALGDLAFKVASNSWSKRDERFDWLKVQKIPCVVSGGDILPEAAIVPEMLTRNHTTNY